MSEPTPAPPLPPPSQVAGDAAAFSQLLAASYKLPPVPGKRRVLDDVEFGKRLATPVPAGLPLADYVVRQLADDEMPGARQYGMLDAVDRILARFYGLPAFHPALTAALLPYRGALAIQALPADGWITNPQHPARRLLAALYALACGWQPESGAAADTARAQAVQWLAALARDERDCGELADHAAQWLDDERRRIERLERRLLDAESGALRTRRARQVAARTLNQALAGRDIDGESAAVIREDWFAGMQWVLLTEGEQSPLWQRVKRATGTLRWTLSPEISEEGHSQFHRVVGQAKEELEALAALLFRDILVRDRLTGTLDAEHLRILRQLPRNTAPFPPVDAGDSVGDGSTEISETLLTEVRALEPGQWLLLREGNTTQRVRLLLRQDETRQLLFVNPQGLKALSCSWEAFALRLANRDALPLRSGAPLQACVVSVINDIAAEHERIQENRQETMRLAREQAEQQARSKEDARQKALAEARRLEEARQEAQRRVAEAQTAADNAARDAAQARLQRARLLASSLTMGAWVVFLDADSNPVRRRLTVILASSGKYIFVEASGDGKTEVTRDELVTGLAEGRIAPVTRDQRLDDALTRIVDGLRQERGSGEKG